MTPFKNYTGLTQEEMAIYLGITRSQWSMFSVGKRKLPTEASLKLNDLLYFLQQNNEVKSNFELLEKENKILKEEFKRKLLDLEVLLFHTEKTISTIVLIRQQLTTAIYAAAFLTTTGHKNLKLTNVIELRIKESLEKNSLQKLFNYQQKKQNLESEIKRIKELL